MNRTSVRITGGAHLMAAAFALLPVPLQPRAANDATDRHEIPIFVLDRIELLSSTAQFD